MGAGVAKVRQGDFDHANGALLHARKLASSAGQPLTEARALLGLSELALTTSDPAQALIFGQQAADVFRDMGALLDAARALTLLSAAHAALGDTDAADAASAEAAALIRKRAAETLIP
jgi:hypothetical protein